MYISTIKEIFDDFDVPCWITNRIGGDDIKLIPQGYHQPKYYREYFISFLIRPLHNFLFEFQHHIQYNQFVDEYVKVMDKIPSKMLSFQTATMLSVVIDSHITHSHLHKPNILRDKRMLAIITKHVDTVYGSMLEANHTSSFIINMLNQVVDKTKFVEYAWYICNKDTLLKKYKIYEWLNSDEEYKRIDLRMKLTGEYNRTANDFLSRRI